MSNQYPQQPPQQPVQGPPQQYGAPYGGPQYGAPAYQGPPQQQQFGGTQYGGGQFGGPPGQQPPPGFGWGPQFPGGPGGPQQPPKKKRSKAAFIVPIVVVLGGIVGLWAYGVIAKQNRMNEYYSQPTSTRSPRPPSPPKAPTARPTRPTNPTATAPKPTTTTKPSPREPTAWEVASRDKIYASGVMRPVGCRESRARANGIAGARAYYMQLKACLDKSWPRNLRVAGDPFRPPTVIAMSGPAQSPCGGGAPSSFYCSTNETIYMDAVGDIQAFHKYPQTYQRNYLRAGMTDTMAHEYGHHVQWLSGTLAAYRELAYDAPNRSVELELARRKEIQATCFGAVFIGANRGSYPMSGDVKKQWNWLTAHSGDEYGTQRDHGSRLIQPYWVNRGFNTRNPALCNTFVASSDKVR